MLPPFDWRHRAPRTPNRARTMPPPPPPAARRGPPLLQRLQDCLHCLHPHRRRRAENQDFALAPMGAAAPAAAPPQFRVRYWHLADHPRGARYGLMPPEFTREDILTAFSLPDSEGRYHECLQGSRPELAMLNMLAMELAGNDARSLSARTDLCTFVQARGGALRHAWRNEDLRDFHQARHGPGLPPLALRRAIVFPANHAGRCVLVWDDDGSPHAQDVQAARVLGLRFTAGRHGQAQAQALLVCRHGTSRFEVRDPRQPQARFLHAGSMADAIGRSVQDIAGDRQPQPCSVFYPDAAEAPPPPADAEVPRDLDPITWL